MVISVRKRRIFLLILMFILLYISIKSLLDFNRKEKHNLLVEHNLMSKFAFSGLNSLIEDYIQKGSTNLLSTINSDKIGGYRDIPHARDKSCKQFQYELPVYLNVSIIIAFINEPRSTLIRTLTSILMRTPSNFINEIILIDDFSDDETIGTNLYFLPLVKVFRNEKREGVIESRNKGAKLAQSDYIVFLDSHCEVNIGWLEPLLYRLFHNPGLAVSPILDSIHPETFEYQKSANYLKGGFNWSLEFQWIPISIEERESTLQSSFPFMSPVFSGGIFAISKKWFLILGGFNNNLEIWGGESIEMSLKLWLCGGQIEIIPCSRIGHVFSEEHTFSFPNGKELTYLKNSKIIAESWLDEYKEIFYMFKPNVRNISFQPDEKLKKLKADLQCRSFTWYSQNVFRELNFPYNALGELKNGAKCLKSIGEQILLKNCSYLEKDGWIFHNETGMLTSSNGRCLTATTKNIALKHCRNEDNQIWIRRDSHLIHNATGLCLENLTGEEMRISACRRGASSQLFSFSIEKENF